MVTNTLLNNKVLLTNTQNKSNPYKAGLDLSKF